MKHTLLFHFLVPASFLLIFAMSAFGQNPVKMYETEWKNIDDFIKKGLPANALIEVKKIYDLAKKEDQDAQLLKAIILLAELQNQTRENNTLVSITEIENDAELAKEPVKSVLNSVLAGMYYAYFSENRWKLYQRTKTVDFQKDDIATWALQDFHDKIGKLYLLSIENEAILKLTGLEAFDAILTKGNTRKLRPTLFDLLAFRALEYFSSNEREIQKPAAGFEMNTASAFDPAADFIHRKFENNDTTSLEYKALLIYQKLISFHIEDKTPDALIDADISRIEFVRNKSVHPDADSLYYFAINHLANQYATTPAAAEAWYLTAQWHMQKGERYDAHKDTSSRYEMRKALEICDKIIKENPDTQGGVNALNLKNSIKEKLLLFSVESVNIPGENFRVLVQYKNFTKLYLKLVNATDALKKDINNNLGNRTKNPVLSAQPIRNWQQDLPDTKDFQKHQVEIKIDALPLGEYFLLASTSENFADASATTGVRVFAVSSISYINQNEHFFVLDRTTGKPLANANVQFWNQTYDYKTSKYAAQKADSYVTDKNGYFKKAIDDSGKPDRNNFRLEITYGRDKFFPEELLYKTYFNNIPEKQGDNKYFLFTDRSIYRPGQTVYYKGIAVNDNHVLEDRNYEIKAILYNANGEKVAETSHYVNDYGTFSGKFQLPQNALNGDFRIEADFEGTINFKVEDYKRPKFEVTYAPVEKAYKVNEQVTVNGRAMAYAGNPIDGASVKYRVARIARFPYPWMSKGWVLPNSAPLEIAHGETVTDKDGKFTVSFAAIPDLMIKKETEPIFNYTIYADVTDSNGETRSAEQEVLVSYKSVLIKLDLPETLSADSLKNLSIRTENANGQFEPSNVAVKISKLKTENRLIRKRFWERPDQFVMTKKEYVDYFPHDEYDNETDQSTWTIEPALLEKTDSLRKNEKFKLSETTRLVPGFYRIDISTKDKDGKETRLVKNFEIVSPDARELNIPEYLRGEGSKPIEPGMKTTVKLVSSAENLFIIQSTFKEQPAQRGQEFSFLTLNKEKKAFNFSVTEADRGGYHVGFMFVKDNRFYQYNDLIQVPWTNKELKIEYASFRNKTLPGSEEKWTVKISGYKQDQVAAEMLASMYDASLDQFYVHQWAKPNIWPFYTRLYLWEARTSFDSKNSNILLFQQLNYKSFDKRYDAFISPELSNVTVRGRAGGGRQFKTTVGAATQTELAGAAPGMMISQDAAALSEVVVVGYGQSIKKDEELSEKETKSKVAPVQIRKNFNETAFFFPDLKTDKDGAITFSFHLPEALTKWKFQALAHTKELALGYSSKEIVTQKELMVQPNPPRFLREGDQINLNSKVVNLTDKPLTGSVSLHLFDAETNEQIDGLLKKKNAELAFTVAGHESASVQFPVQIPENFSKTIVWRIVATSGSLSDGEENILPVLPNSMLVTESLPLNMKGIGTKQFRFEKLANSAKSSTLKNQSLTLEYTSNPAWYAVQALPYLMEYPHDCAEQTWNRFYANALASNISNSSPRISRVFESWKTLDTTALMSGLQTNPELKSIILEETPWVLAGKSEAEQKRNIGLLFDLAKMSRELTVNLTKLKEMQSPGGGFVWFKGGPDDRYMTQYIVAGIGHLQKLNAVQKDHDIVLKSILNSAIPYLDAKLKLDYDQLLKDKSDLKNYVPGALEIQYLYMRSFFPTYKIPAASQRAYTFYFEKAVKTWVSQNKYLQGMIALAAHRTKDANTAKAILKSLDQTAIKNEELGMYWKTTQSWWWHENPIERQALLIEAFSEAGSDTKTVDELRTWLLKNKQTNRWESTKATAEACYALLLKGTDWLTSEPTITIQLGDRTISSKDEKQQDGTGYFKKQIPAAQVIPSMGDMKVSVSNSNKGTTATTWGAVYWQYFEHLDKITFAETPLKIEKKLFIEKNTDNGPVLTPVNEGDQLAIGDRIKVRIVLRVDRDMEYLHMKDMRASALEPVNVLSSYKWQGGLGYYESTRDASTNFFFNYLKKGTYVFEYPLFVTHGGDFSNGVITIQSMYAPEFTAHSEGVRIKVKE